MHISKNTRALGELLVEYQSKNKNDKVCNFVKFSNLTDYTVNLNSHTLEIESKTPFSFINFKDGKLIYFECSLMNDKDTWKYECSITLEGSVETSFTIVYME